MPCNRTQRILWAAFFLLCSLGVVPEGSAAPVPPKKEPQANKHVQEKIKIFLHLGLLRQALLLSRQYLSDHPDDREGYYLLASATFKSGNANRALAVLDHGLLLFPGDEDLLYLKATILMGEKHYGRARTILLFLYKKHPNDRGIQQDLNETLVKSGLVEPNQILSTNFLQATATQPPPSPSMLLLPTLSQWKLSSNVYSLLYPGGTSLVVDTRLSTPMEGESRFFTGRTEYLGYSSDFGNGTNAFTYAGTELSLGEGTHVVLEAGDTSVRPSAGLYGRIDKVAGPLSVSLQGFGNMVWGDFGESIAQNGVENGMVATASYQLLPRLGFSAEYWYFDYFLENGQIPYGSLHNTTGMFDLNLAHIPQLDLVGGYDSWTEMSPPDIAGRVPILPEQRYFLLGISFEKQYESLWTVTGEFGGYDDIYLHLASYETSAGISYQLGPRWQFYSNGYYFNQSTLVSGSVESFMGGFQFWF